VRNQERRGRETATRSWEAWITRGLTHRQIAKDVGMTQGAVTKAFARARRERLAAFTGGSELRFGQVEQFCAEINRVRRRVRQLTQMRTDRAWSLAWLEHFGARIVRVGGDVLENRARGEGFVRQVRQFVKNWRAYEEGREVGSSNRGRPKKLPDPFIARCAWEYCVAPDSRLFAALSARRVLNAARKRNLLRVAPDHVTGLTGKGNDALARWTHEEELALRRAVTSKLFPGAHD
jgi:hypothetical protein